MAVLNREYDSLVNVIQTDSIIMPSIDEITKSGQLKYTQVSSMVWIQVQPIPLFLHKWLMR